MRLSGFENSVTRFSKFCNWLSCVAVLAMMCVVCANVVMRFFDMAVLGTFEYVELISAVIISFGLAYTGVIKAHVAVDLVVRRFSMRIQGIIEIILNIVVFGFIGILAWKMAQFGSQNFKLNLATETMAVPLYPFNFMISFGLFALLFVLISDTVNSIKKVVQK